MTSSMCVRPVAAQRSQKNAVGSAFDDLGFMGT